MKLEYLSDYSEEYPDESLVRLFDFDQKEAKLFAELIRLKIIDKKVNVDLSKVGFIESLNCLLYLVIGPKDMGIERVNDQQFICELTEETYKKMVELIQPFTENIQGYQWLYEIDTPISFLFSPGGKMVAMPEQ